MNSTSIPSAAPLAPNSTAARQAYVTLLSSDNYLAPVLVLHHSLQRVGSTRKFVVLVTPNLAPATIDCLARMKIETRLIQTIANPAAQEHLKNIWRRLKGTYRKINLYATVYTKLRIWELTEFSKVVFLDSDMMVLANIDELFDRPNWSAANSGGELPQYRHWRGMNSGLLVIDPSAAVFADMMSKTKLLKSGDWGDQGFITAYFPEWTERADLHLPHGYNMPVEFLDQYAALGYRVPDSSPSDDKTIKIIHYWRAHRPWQVPLKNWDLAMAQATPLYFEAFRLWMREFAEVSEKLRGAAAASR